MAERLQRTIAKKVSFSGIGLHTGNEVQLTLLPSEKSGVYFQRTDLPGKPIIPVHVDNVSQTARSTMIGRGNCTVQTVEHLLAAVHAYGIDNLCIQVNAGEPPIGDGSSKPFVELLDRAGICELNSTICTAKIEAPVYFSEGGSHLVALPSDEFRISYTLHYPQVSLIRSQYFSFVLNEKNFKEQIASARTFALYNEIDLLTKQGLIRGGSLENAVVIKDDVILSKEGLRFSDEMVRHKILDVIGDLFLVGQPFLGHIIAVCSGHRTNVGLGQKLRDHFSSQLSSPFSSSFSSSGRSAP